MTLEHAIGRTIQGIRESRGWTRKELAKRVGVQPDTIARLEEHATDYVRWDIIRDTATALRLKPSALIELAERLQPQYERQEDSMRVMRRQIAEAAA